MENNMYVSSLCDGVSFRSIRETRFKDSILSVHFLLPLSRENATVNAVMSTLLFRTCAKYPGYDSLRRALAMLYGADVSTSVANLGSSQMITVEIQMNDDRFIPGNEPVSVECAELLSELIFRPLRDGDGEPFTDEEVAIAVRTTKERIEARINNKELYALHRMKDIMCENEIISVEAGGYIEDLPGMTRAALAQAWRRMLRTATVNIIMVGGAAHEPVESIFAREFNKVERCPQPLPEPPAKKAVEREKRAIERMDVAQCKMMVGMRIPIIEPDDRAIAAKLMSILYGGSPTSLLFENLREKLSLCYYCSSVYLRASGLLLVSCGLEEENVDMAVGEIKQQLAVLAGNEFSEDVFNASKLYAISGYEQIHDSVESIENWYCMQFLDGCVRTPEQAAERMMAVTRAQVAECASLVQVDTVYLLAPQEDEESGGEEGGEAGE